MIEPGWIPSSQGGAVPCATEGASSAFEAARARGALRRVRYYCTLLITGYRHALSPDPQSRSLRTERIALGIDLPELDTVPLWSSRRDDGTVSIPFIEFILAQIYDGLEGSCADPSPLARPRVEALTRVRLWIGEVLQKAAPEGGTSELPRLGDVYISEELLKEVCGPEGFLEALLSMPELRVD